MLQELATIFLLLLAFDAVWLTLTASQTRAMIAAIQKQPLSIRWIPALVVYIVMAGAIYWFAVAESKTVHEATLRGAGIGVAMYGVYDMTNHATLAQYPLQFALTDIVWGTTLCATTAAAAKWLNETRI